MFVMLLFCCCSGVIAGSLNKIIFFGDSLSDNGNLYKLLLKIIPKSPPYFKGRFSNGRVWSESIGKYYYDKYYIDYKVYAWGGATALLHFPTPRFISPTNLEIEVDGYLIEHFFSDKSRTLFSVWIGGNDYLYYQDTDADALTTKVVDKIKWAMNNLIDNGARYFLVLNLPDLAKTPFAKAHGSIPVLHLLTELHNQKLAAAVEEVKSANPNVRIVYYDVHELFNDFSSNPGKYNKKYNTNVTNTVDACWRGGYLLKNTNVSKEAVNSQVRKMLLETNGSIPKDVDTMAISEFVLNSPSVYHAYEMGQWFNRGLVPCLNPNQYLFWDEMHPSEVVHKVLSEIVLEHLTKEIPS